MRSVVSTPTPAALATANGAQGLSPATVAADLELPHPYPRVAELARRITAGSRTTYAKVIALERWIGRHTRYTLDIPPLLPGQDTVDQFLFVTHRGYCEQISTTLAVMLRTLGIPAREATGYVPGPFDPVTDVYEVEAKDAHAWVQVWFPGFGWQSFDPTADVPLANPSPADAFAHELVSALGQVPLVPTVPLALALAALGFALAWWHRRPATWQGAVTRDLVRAARSMDLSVSPADTLGAIAARLDAVLAGRNAESADIARAAEAAAWQGAQPTATPRTIVRAAHRVRRAARREGWRRARRRRALRRDGT